MFFFQISNMTLNKKACTNKEYMLLTTCNEENKHGKLSASLTKAWTPPIKNLLDSISLAVKSHEYSDKTWLLYLILDTL